MDPAQTQRIHELFRLDESFSYEDTLSDPKLEVINQRVISYRLLEYDDRIICDEINGLRGKALSGFLKLLGKADMRQYRMIAAGETQYARMTTKKWWIRKRTDMTISASGTTSKGVPRSQEAILHRKIKIEYGPKEKSLAPCTCK